MDWSWKVFLIALPIMVIVSMFSRGALNARNVANYGSEADYQSNSVMTFIGSLFGGVVWAAIITAIIGLI